MAKMTIKKFLGKWQLDVITIAIIAILVYFAGTPTGIAASKQLLVENPLAFYALFVPLATIAFAWGYARIKERMK